MLDNEPRIKDIQNIWVWINVNTRLNKFEWNLIKSCEIEMANIKENSIMDDFRKIYATRSKTIEGNNTIISWVLNKSGYTSWYYFNNKNNLNYILNYKNSFSVGIKMKYKLEKLCIGEKRLSIQNVELEYLASINQSS